MSAAEGITQPLSDRLDTLAALTGAFAHDFNNLLTVIRGSAELAARDPAVAGSDAGRHVAAVIDAADGATRLTEALLSFARRMPLQPRAIDLAAVLADTKAALAGRIDLSVRLLVPRDLPPVHADLAALKAAIARAADNAVEAMPDGGVLTFAAVADRTAGTIQLTVIDSGAGMPPAVTARAFEPFFTTKPIGAGPGLGLSQVHGFAAQSGGSASLSSAPGRGTRLQLVLPIATGVPVDAPTTAAARALGPGTRVLLVEDSNAVAAFAEALLTSMGCTVTHAACADEALARLAEAPDAFDVLFSDIVMPGMSGLELAQRVHAERPELPILLATAHSEAAARHGSAFPILPKPYRREALAEMLSMAMAA